MTTAQDALVRLNTAQSLRWLADRFSVSPSVFDQAVASDLTRQADEVEAPLLAGQSRAS